MILVLSGSRQGRRQSNLQFQITTIWLINLYSLPSSLLPFPFPPFSCLSPSSPSLPLHLSSPFCLSNPKRPTSVSQGSWFPSKKKKTGFKMQQNHLCMSVRLSKTFSKKSKDIKNKFESLRCKDHRPRENIPSLHFKLADLGGPESEMLSTG